MKRSLFMRICSMLLVVCLLAGMLPTFLSHVEVEANAVSGVDSLTCSGFISNSVRRNYIDTMMKYYINNNSSLQSALNSGKSVVFMFEGGSDHYDSYPYIDASYTYRLQAVCIVVQLNSSGNAQIVFYSENCSSIPDDANYVTPRYETNGSTTILDGIYSMKTVNHNGNYAAHTTNCSTGWYTPYDGSTGYSAACNGINIHTRGTSYNLTYGGQSMGCQLIGYGASSSNEYNQFMKVVADCTFNAYDGTQRTFKTSDTNVSKGYYVVDRQLGLLSPDGTEYGSGSLMELYTKTDLTNITKFSTNARANADFGYTNKCTFYPSYCQFQTTKSTPINSEPCSAGSNTSETMETATAGATYTAVGMYENTAGNLWYQIKTDSGKTGYIYSGHTTYVKELTPDVALSSGATYPNGVVQGNVFVVNGTISATYNNLKSVSVYIHQGFGRNGTIITGDSATVNGKSYTLDSSTIDYNTSFNSLSTGKHTYAISAEYVNYYAKSAQELGTNTGTLDLMTEYFMVIPSSVSQSSCAHSYTTTTVTAASCTASGAQVKSCATCGKIQKETVAAAGHNYGQWIVNAATCTTPGSKTRTCAACGHEETVTIEAGGHNYILNVQDATCQSYAVLAYTCSACGDYYELNTHDMTQQWLDYLPAGMDVSEFITKTQYRYSDYETATSFDTSLAGYTLKSSTWIQSETGSVRYVNSWPSGFDTSSAMYTQYNKKSQKKSSSETATEKITVNSDAHIGYLYYHWCSSSDSNHYSYASKSSTHNIFHAYYSTTAPDNYTCDPSDMSYKTSNSTCSNGNSAWFFVTDVYEQKYTTYQKQFTYERWTEFSEWSDTVATAGDTRKVETRTVYQLKNASLGDHVWNEGVCDICNTECLHNFIDGVCSICDMAEGKKEYYLFGYINGANYGCDEDYANIGIYRFEDGKLVATFTKDSYVAVKTGDNLNWYMTDGYPGDHVSTATLYSSDITGSRSDKLHVPAGREITFTLTENDDGSLTLSYVAATCVHDWNAGVCFICGEHCSHSYAGGVCTICGIEEPVTVVKPTLTLSYPNLNLKDVIYYNIYYTASNLSDVVEMGLITFDSALSTGTIADAAETIPGYIQVGDKYMSHTNGVTSMKLGDALYFKVYAKLSDGTYVYSSMAGYHAVAYAKDILQNSTNEKMKALVVAMLNYGAASQQYFNYKTDSLVNSFLTDEQKALVEEYRADMVGKVQSASASKVGAFTYTSGGYTELYPTAAFEGAFAINFYFTPAHPLDGNLTLYYWTLEDYSTAKVLTTSNASVVVQMTPTGNGGRYIGTVEGIAAKDIDKTIYVSGLYQSGGTYYSTGVIAYSLGTYCLDRVANGTATMQALASQTIVYGYYAKDYFANL